MLQHFDTVMSFAVVMLLLSLLVTTLVQMLIAVSGLRGSILQGGIEKLLVHLSPGLKAHAEQIAKAVLTHPLIQGAGEKRATSIRKEELVRLLDDLANRSPALDGLPATKNALREFLGVAEVPEIAAAAGRLKHALDEQFPEAVKKVQLAVGSVLNDLRKPVLELGNWFDTVMDRTTENFLVKTRWITAGVASILAFTLHVDSLGIIRQLSSQPELRAKLIQSADVTLKKADKTFALTADEMALASGTIAAVRAGLSNSPAAQLITNVPVDLTSRNQGADWLATTLAGATNREAILADYQRRFETNSLAWLSDLSESARELNQTLRDPDLVIIPSPTPAAGEYFTKPGHFLGTLMTVFFLSLGAPFWYNALRQLANLRPAVAEKIEPKSRSNK